MAPSAVVFDLDGTLIDSRSDIAGAVNHALAAHGFRTLSVERIGQFVGDGALPLLARASGLDPRDQRLTSLYAEFIAYYQKHPADFTALCAGAADVLDGRLGLPLGLCTNKPRVTTLRVLEALGIFRVFGAIVAGGDLPQTKPDPAPVLRAAALLGVDAASLVMVGDGAQDILAGRAAGARTVGVQGGIQPEDRLLHSEPDALIPSLVELPELLRRWA